MTVSNLNKFHTWKIIFIWITQGGPEPQRIQICQLQVTKVQKIARFLREIVVFLINILVHQGCRAKKITACLWIFCHVLDEMHGEQ